jgi:uncharacterized protein (DUF608 family)
LGGAAAQTGGAQDKPRTTTPAARTPAAAPQIQYPRTFRGRGLATIAFPLGGVAAGSLSLGGRGQLRDWEIFNKPDKGNSLPYAFPCIWVQAGKAKPIARVLEARLMPPYEGASGLGSRNSPGLSRLAGATFTGEYPIARVDFTDAKLPVKVTLEAFTPFIPHEPDESGIPATVLRYRVSNPSMTPARVSIAWSIDNPVGARPARGGAASAAVPDGRVNQYRKGAAVEGLLMSNPSLPADDPMQGDFALALAGVGDGKVTWLRGWPKGRWWNSPMLFWDDFSEDGALGPEPPERSLTGALCLERTIAPRSSCEYAFVLAWRFPNRTPERCGWSAPKGEEKTLIGNWYCTRFAGAWDAAEYLAANLPALEKKTRTFVNAIRESRLPGAVKDAAMANLSTLVSTTCFRTADGEFHGFEGVNDKAGCCFGNCTHVWNYETTTPHLFPSFARSLRKAAFGYTLDDSGAIHFRQMLPDGKQRSGLVAADGQMGQIMHAYLDWRLSGDNEWLRGVWPRVKKALEFAWVKGGWDADRDGVTEGVQHNTYDVEFFGPNPQCGVYYLGGLRAGEEMARAVGDAASADEYRRLFEKGKAWTDANLFNGEYYIQKVRPASADDIAPYLRSKMGADDPSKPEYQLGEGCLIDQLVGQYMADVAGLGPLVEPKHIRKTMESIWRYNHRASLEEHDSVQRIYALNDDAALLVCDYGKAKRPHIPFPYYAEAWTGVEYMAGSQMMYAGLVKEGVQVFQDSRTRHDGERRNPWDEPECGHHYARAMSAWSGMAALAGFLYHGGERSLALTPRWGGASAKSFWATATGWGVYTWTREAGRAQLKVEVLHGSLACRACELPFAGKAKVSLDGKPVAAETARKGAVTSVRLQEDAVLQEGGSLHVEVTV